MVRPQLVVAAIVFTLLAMVAYWVLRPESMEQAAAYFSLRRGIPDTLVVAYRDTTVMVPRPEGWRLIEPVDDLADGVAVEALLKRLRAFEVDRRLSYDPVQAMAYGLGPPRCMVVARYSDSPPETLSIGYPNAASPKVYVRRGSQGDVGLVPKHIPETYFMKNTQDWRSPYLISVHETEIVSFGFQGEKQPPVRLELNADNSWWVREPYPGPADDDYVHEVLKTFARLEILNYRDRAVPGRASDPILGWVISTKGDSSWIVLESSFHPDSSLARAKSRPAGLVVSTKYRSFFSQNPDAYRATKMFALGLGALDSLRVAPEGLHLGRERWTQGEDGRALASVLKALLALRAEEFLEVTPEWSEVLLELPHELLLYGKEGLLVGMSFGPWGVSQVAFWLDRGPGSRPGEIFLVSEATFNPLLEFIRGSGS